MFLNTLRVAVAGLLVSAFALTGPAAPVPAERAKAEKELAAVAIQLHGSWLGEGGCVGRLTLRADRTYEWTGIGPGGDRDSGAWALRGEPTAPVLILKCQTSDDLDREGKTVEMKLVQLEAKSLTFKNLESSQRFLRAKCGVP